jgi:hypothetical protein
MRPVSSAGVRKTLDRLAYASLVLDICIAAITTLSFFDVGNPQVLLVPVNYLLTAVVALSIVMFVVLFLLRSKERQATKGDKSSQHPDK